MSPLEDCCFRCVGCDLVHCTQNDTSPGETDNLCPSCWLTEDDDRTEADLLAAHDGLGFRSPAVAAEWASIADNAELGSWFADGMGRE